MEIRQVLNAVEGARMVSGSGGSPAMKFTGVAYDSRRVRPGALFIALRGLAFDGNRFLDDARRRGAVAALSDATPTPTPTDAPLPLIAVPDARLALAQVASLLYARAINGLTTIGVTGTNGKSTCAMLIQHVLQNAGRRTGLVGTIVRDLGYMRIPSTMTTPESLDLLADLARISVTGCTHAVVEVSSHALVQHRVATTSFALSAFTNLSQDHLDFHGTMEHYAAAKATLFEKLRPEAVAVVNADDPYAERMTRDCPARVIRYGLKPPADVRAEQISLSLDGTRFRLITRHGTADVHSPLMGRFNVANALCAAAVALEQGVSLTETAAAIESFPGVPGRLQTVAAPHLRGLRVLVDYAHTDDALVNVLTTLRQLRPRRIITVFGCGGDRDAGKRPKMGRAAARFSDVVIVTNDNPRTEDPKHIVVQIVPGLAGGAARCLIEYDRARAIQRAIDLAGPGDVVLIAGKGHEDYQIVGRRKLPFDDRIIAREALSRRAS